MTIVILGAGALGTVLSAHLARAGEDVTLIARGQRAVYLQEHGATITGLVDFTVPITVVTDPQQMHEAEVLIVTVKTYDMESALQSIKHLQVESVLSLQNGVLKNEQLAQTFGWDKVLGAMTHFSAEVLPTGTVRFRTNQGVYLGELPEGTSPRVQTLGDLFEHAGIAVKTTPHIQSFEWSKYVAWICLMAPAVLTRLEGYNPGSRGCGHEWGFLLRRCTSLYYQGDLRYDGTSQKLCRRGTSWPLLFSTFVRWPTCHWCWGSSASSTSLHLSIPSALHTPRMSSRVAVV